MKIEALERTWKVQPITWGQRRRLHAEHSQVYAPSLFSDSGEAGELRIDWDKYYSTIELVLSIAFSDPENDLKGLSDPEIDKLAQSILQRYLNQEDDSKKENGGSD